MSGDSFQICITVVGMSWLLYIQKVHQNTESSSLSCSPLSDFLLDPPLLRSAGDAEDQTEGLSGTHILISSP